MSVEPPARLSPSSWKTWEQCPLKYRLKHIDRVPDPAGVAAELGSFAHKVWERLYQAPRTERHIGLARTIAADVWATETPETVTAGTITPREFKGRSWRFVTALWELEEPTEVDVASTEERVEFVERDVPMVCVIDRTIGSPDSLAPGDYKTGALPKRPEHGHAARRQIVVNGLALRATGRTPADEGHLLYVAHEHVEAVPLDRKALETVSLSAALTWGEITDACATETFEPRGSALCAFCPYVSACPVGQTETRRALAYWRKPPPEDAPGVIALRAIENDAA